MAIFWNSHWHKAVVLLPVVFMVFGCSLVRYRYIPVEKTVNSVRDGGTAVYMEPSNMPSGHVRVSSLGVEDLKLNPNAEKVHVLHLKMAISHQDELSSAPSDQSSNASGANETSAGHGIWTLDTQDQTVAFPNKIPKKPILTRSNEVRIEKLEIPQGQLRTLDLFFELPEQWKSEEDIPEFDFLWKIQAGNHLISEFTPFDRMKILPAGVASYPYAPYPYDANSYGMGYGWGPVWTGDPYFFP